MSPCFWLRSLRSTVPRLSARSACPAPENRSAEASSLAVDDALLLEVERHQGKLADARFAGDAAQDRDQGVGVDGLQGSGAGILGREVDQHLHVEGRIDAVPLHGRFRPEGLGVDLPHGAGGDVQGHLLVLGRQRGLGVPVEGANALGRGRASASRCDTCLRRRRRCPAGRRRPWRFLRFSAHSPAATCRPGRRDGRDIEQDNLVRSGFTMRSRQLGGITGIAQLDELNTFHHTSRVNVEAGDDAFGQRFTVHKSSPGSSVPHLRTFRDEIGLRTDFHARPPPQTELRRCTSRPCHRTEERDRNA